MGAVRVALQVPLALALQAQTWGPRDPPVDPMVEVALSALGGALLWAILRGVLDRAALVREWTAFVGRLRGGTPAA